jgi:uncharacterized membrane protein YccF (DUF307 family)
MILLRALYFIIFGWWAGIIWSLIAYVLCLTIIGLPIGLMMFNRLPQVLTLKPISEIVLVNKEYLNRKQEFPLIIRALYFILIGWHITGVWVGIALFLCITIIGMPLGIMMLNHVPLILTLKQRY